MNGKGDKRRPQVIDNRQLEFNWERTFNNDNERRTDYSRKSSGEVTSNDAKVISTPPEEYFSVSE